MSVLYMYICETGCIPVLQLHHAHLPLFLLTPLATGNMHTYVSCCIVVCTPVIVLYVSIITQDAFIHM